MDNLVETLEQHKEKMQDIAYKELYESMAKMHNHNFYKVNVLYSLHPNLDALDMDTTFLMLNEKKFLSITKHLDKKGFYTFKPRGSFNKTNTELYKDENGEIYIVKIQKYEFN